MGMNVTEGASEGGLGLSAPTDPCLLRYVLPCRSPETKHSGPEPAGRPPGQREMLSGGCPSARQALGGSTLRVKQGTVPAKHRPFPRRMALQRSGRVTALLGAQAFCPVPLPSTARPAARSRTRTHTCTHKHAHHWDKEACVPTNSRVGILTPAGRHLEAGPLGGD